MGRLEDFADLVFRMRDAQTAYFRDRTKTRLADAKRLEAEVDRECRRIAWERSKPSLFDDSEGGGEP